VSQVKHRKWDLEQYVSSLLKLPRVGACELLLAFLEATPDACALRNELDDARQKLQDAIIVHEKTVEAQVKVDTENTQLLFKLQKARDDLAQAQRLHQKGEEELAQLAPKINDQASRLEKNTQKLQLLRSDIREKLGDIESLNERMLALHRCCCCCARSPCRMKHALKPPPSQPAQRGGTAAVGLQAAVQQQAAGAGCKA
jgi:DNA repair exonuclease SbcCD ATPase subunit